MVCLRKQIPQELVYDIYTYTEEFSRELARKKKLKRFGKESNNIFPRNFVEYIDFYVRDRGRLWDYSQRDNIIEKEVDNYNLYGKLPSMQFSTNKNHDYLDTVFHNVKYEDQYYIWGITNYYNLLSYSLIVSENKNVILFTENIAKIKNAYHYRLEDHNIKTLEQEYITFVTSQDGIPLCNCTPIICVEYSTKCIQYINKFINNNVYILKPYSANNEIMNKHIKSTYCAGGVYKIT